MTTRRAPSTTNDSVERVGEHRGARGVVRAVEHDGRARAARPRVAPGTRIVAERLGDDVVAEPRPPNASAAATAHSAFAPGGDRGATRSTSSCAPSGVAIVTSRPPTARSLRVSASSAPRRQTSRAPCSRARPACSSRVDGDVVAEHRDGPGLHDARLVARDRLDGVAEHLGVVERDVGDHGDASVHHVGRVPGAAEARPRRPRRRRASSAKCRSAPTVSSSNRVSRAPVARSRSRSRPSSVVERRVVDRARPRPRSAR